MYHLNSLKKLVALTRTTFTMFYLPPFIGYLTTFGWLCVKLEANIKFGALEATKRDYNTLYALRDKQQSSPVVLYLFHGPDW